MTVSILHWKVCGGGPPETRGRLRRQAQLRRLGAGVSGLLSRLRERFAKDPSCGMKRPPKAGLRYEGFEKNVEEQSRQLF
jgi:hypothetical protein